MARFKNLNTDCDEELRRLIDTDEPLRKQQARR
jgi:hypothetical protein